MFLQSHAARSDPTVTNCLLVGQVEVNQIDILGLVINSEEAHELILIEVGPKFVSQTSVDCKL